MRRGYWWSPYRFLEFYVMIRLTLAYLKVYSLNVVESCLLTSGLHRLSILWEILKTSGQAIKISSFLVENSKIWQKEEEEQKHKTEQRWYLEGQLVEYEMALSLVGSRCWLTSQSESDNIFSIILATATSSLVVVLLMVFREEVLHATFSCLFI